MAAVNILIRYFTGTMSIKIGVNSIKKLKAEKLSARACCFPLIHGKTYSVKNIRCNRKLNH